MDVNGLYIYLLNSGLSIKVSKDIISRINRLEKVIINFDIEQEYLKNECKNILDLLSKNADVHKLKKMLTGKLPIGNYTMNTYKYAIRKYVKFKNQEKNT